ncbi:MAG TPA: hypothetical protein VGR90_08600, partial [Acidimicrobiales bacterium]|nr:hypothetical protein [Acidimicrobiales bacterium]
MEVAWGEVTGFDAVAPAMPSGNECPLSALESAILPALLRRPCVVAFSGGRDSSAVLAAAVNLARRLGLDEPVALSRSYPRAPAADETTWQEMLVRHLGLAEWVTVESDDLDLLGPVGAT